MAPKTAISYTAIILGLGFYYVTISALISYRTTIVDREVIFQGIDTNKDGKLSRKEIDNFNPCDTEFTKLNEKLDKLGNKVNFKKFNGEVTDVLTECVTETSDITNPSKIWNRDLEEISEELFDIYDLNEDNTVSWKEYHSINSYNKRPLKNEKEVFSFFDKNSDWRITRKELAKVKLQKIKPRKE